MNQETGEIKTEAEVKALSPEEQADYIELTEDEFQLLRNMKFSQRVDWLFNQKRLGREFKVLTDSDILGGK